MAASEQVIIHCRPEGAVPIPQKNRERDSSGSHQIRFPVPFPKYTDMLFEGGKLVGRLSTTI